MYVVSQPHLQATLHNGHVEGLSVHVQLPMLILHLCSPMHLCSLQPQARLLSSQMYLLCLAVLQGMDMMTAKLTNCLRAPGVTVSQAAEAIKHLLHLHAEGARSTHNLDIIKLYLEAQVRFTIADVGHPPLCTSICLSVGLQ